MTLKQKLENFTQEIIIGIVMIFVLLPVRVLFVEYVSDDWLGSFGLISLVIISLLILSKKNKLGLFGRMFWKQTVKVTKGKRRIVAWTILTINIYFWISVVAGINLAESNDEIQIMKQDLRYQLTESEQEQIQELNKAIEAHDVQEVNRQLSKQIESYSPEMIIIVALALVALPIFDFNTWSLIMSLTDDFTEGYLLHFSTVFMVESLEMVGIIIYAMWSTRTKSHFNK